MRHGEAEVFAASDLRRELTDRGKQLLRRALNDNKTSLVEVDCIIHSPFIRAIQTAQLAAEALVIKNLQCSELWTPEADPHKALESLEQFTESCCPLIITHMPLVSRVEALCTGNPLYPQPFSCGEISEVTADFPGINLGVSKRV